MMLEQEGHGWAVLASGTVEPPEQRHGSVRAVVTADDVADDLGQGCAHWQDALFVGFRRSYLQERDDLATLSA